MKGKYWDIISIKEKKVVNHKYYHSSFPDDFTEFPSILPINMETLDLVKTISLNHSNHIELNKNVKRLDTKLYLK